MPGMGDERDQVSGVIVHDGQQGILRHDEIEFLRRDDGYRRGESARGIDGRFDVRRNLQHIRTPALEQYVAAVQQRADIRVPEIKQHVAQNCHRDAFVAAYIDAANERDAFAH